MNNIQCCIEFSPITQRKMCTLKFGQNPVGTRSVAHILFVHEWHWNRILSLPCSSAHHILQQHGPQYGCCGSFEMRRFISSGELSSLLRPFYFAVHPDLFGQYPEQRVNRVIVENICCFDVIHASPQCFLCSVTNEHSGCYKWLNFR